MWYQKTAITIDLVTARLRLVAYVGPLPGNTCPPHLCPTGFFHSSVVSFRLLEIGWVRGPLRAVPRLALQSYKDVADFLNGECWALCETLDRRTGEISTIKHIYEDREEGHGRRRRGRRDTGDWLDG